VIDGFDGFDVFDVATPQSTVFGRSGGRGSPVLLLHGMPETHLMWHRVVPRLATRFRVIATDLQGFGRSGMPASAADHGPYSMRSGAASRLHDPRLGRLR
jgi:haloacetate dehalogenase